MNKAVCINKSDKMNLLKEIKNKTMKNILAEKGANLLKEKNVEQEWVLRPLYFLYLNDKLTKEEFETRIFFMEYDYNIEYDKHKIREIYFMKEKSEIPENCEYAGYKSVEEWLEIGEVGFVAAFYNGYLPYAYDIEKKQYINISFSLDERNFE